MPGDRTRREDDARGREPGGSEASPVALVYLRVSTGEQERSGVSLGVQRARCRAYLEGSGWRSGGEYVDVMPGDRTARPNYRALLADVRRLRKDGRGVVVFVASLDRLGRRLLELVRCREELKSLGAPLHGVREGGEVPDVVANILAAVAEDELQRRRERLWTAVRQVVASGWYPPGACPWGYRLRPATPHERREGAPREVLAADPAMAACVREAYARYARGESRRAIAAWIAGQPSAARGGRQLSAHELGRTLRNPAYVARPHWGAARVLDRPPGRWPALVDDAVWERVQRRLASPVAGRGSGQYLLTSFLRCPRCGARASQSASAREGRPAPPWRRYSCNGRGTCHTHVGPAAQLDAIVLREVKHAVIGLMGARRLDPAALAARWEAMRRPSPATLRLAERAEASAARARTRLARAAERLAIGDLDPDGYELVRDAAEADLGAATAAADGARAVPALPPLPSVLERAHAWCAALASGGVRAQREVLGELVDRVDPRWIEPGAYEVDVTWTALGRAVLDAPRRARGRRASDA
jgi:DNA invertase Pin-like site-specific DNA recombinase